MPLVVATEEEKIVFAELKRLAPDWKVLDDWWRGEITAPTLDHLLDVMVMVENPNFWKEV